MNLQQLMRDSCRVLVMAGGMNVPAQESKAWAAVPVVSLQQELDSKHWMGAGRISENHLRIKGREAGTRMQRETGHSHQMDWTETLCSSSLGNDSIRREQRKECCCN